MLVPKILAVCCGISLANVWFFGWANANGDTPTSTGALALVGIITMVSTAIIGAYGRYREVRAKADAHDIRLEMDFARQEIARLQEDRDRWKALYEAVATGAARPLPKKREPK